MNNEDDVTYMCVCVCARTCMCIHTHGQYYSALKKNEILPFPITWMDLEGGMLSELSQTEKDKYCVTLFR